MSSEPITLQQIHVDRLELDNPFWQFSLEQWRNPALQQQLLDMQNTRNLRINLLLLSMWMSFAHRDIRPHLADFISASRAWHEQVVAPLRTTRKSLPASAVNLKKRVQACELEAEQIEQALLYAYNQQLKPEQTPGNQNKHLDSLDWLILNLSASELTETDLSLLIQNCLPSYPSQRIEDRIKQHRVTFSQV